MTRRTEDDGGPLRLLAVRAPNTARRAIRMIIVATIGVTVVGAVMVRVVDPTDFPSFGEGAWWSLQTVTTVGYGDVTPVQPLGRLVGAVVLLYSVAFMSILTAVITTSFIEQARRDRQVDQPDLETMIERLEAVLTRLDHVEHADPGPPSPEPR
jgi:voltage-gated potassium channel